MTGIGGTGMIGDPKEKGERPMLDEKMVAAVPGLVADAYAKYNEDLEARCRVALAESQAKLEAVRAEIVSLAQAQFSEAEKQIGLTAEQIESRILGALTEAAKERITKLERGLVIEIQHAVNAALPKQELAAAPTLIDSYRGQWKEGMVAQRGDLFSWYGSTYLALEDTNDIGFAAVRVPEGVDDARVIVVAQPVVEIDHAADELRREDADAAVVQEIDACGPALLLEHRVVAEMRVAVDWSAERAAPTATASSAKRTTPRRT